MPIALGIKIENDYAKLFFQPPLTGPPPKLWIWTFSYIEVETAGILGKN